MKIGIYGGTFDPPHRGHMEAARAAVGALGLDKLLFIPAKLPPHKALGTESAPAADRLAMIALMAEGLGLAGRAAALDVELTREGPSYTVDTLEHLRTQYPEDELFLLMGSDMFLTLQDWCRPKRIIELATIVAFARTESATDELFAVQTDYLRRIYGAKVITITLPEIIDISSTKLRTVLAKGGEGACALWPPVYGYILRERLYGIEVDLAKLSDDALRAVSYSMVRARRIPHIHGTEETAVALAHRWGEDETAARRAAILHDCTKYLNMEEQLALCAKYNVALDPLEQVTLKLLHAKTGAALAQHVFGQPQEVVEAIRWHTTGRSGMSALEKIVYLADYMEPTRDFDGVASLRALVWEDLDRAMYFGLSMTVEDMAVRNMKIHGNTLAALDDAKGMSQ